MPDQVKLTIVEPDGKEYSLWAPTGKSVWEALELMGWDRGGSCAGQGTCGKCKVRISGGISPISPSEREHLMPEEIKAEQRLACLAIIKGDFTLRIDYWPNNEWSKKSLFRYQPDNLCQSQVISKKFYISGRQQDFHTPIYDRVKKALHAYRLELSPKNINYLAGIDRPGRPTLELHAVIVNDYNVQYIGRHRQALYGIAFDIGSTSLFGALLDLETGRSVAMASQSNMQRIYGDDIISRVNWALENEEGSLTLHRILINNLNSMIEEMLEQEGLSSLNIYKLTAVGNPVMLHFLLGLNTSCFGSAPYNGIFSEEIQVSASSLGLNVNPLSQLAILPQLGGFVGSDTTACLLTLLPREKESFILIDIGTNGEIVLHNQGRMWAASAAAGPAFEGGAISCGMRAGQGAIDKVFFENGKFSYRVIGEVPPRGICGSGIVDLIAILLKSAYLDTRGNFTEKVSAQFETRIGERGMELVLVPGEQTLSGIAIILNQEDIRQVQLARSAIRAAIDIMLIKAEMKLKAIDKIYVAGTFGTYLDPNSIQGIGLLPPVDIDKIKNIGNAAANGAILALLSLDKMNEASIIKSKVQYLELAEQENFQALFLKNIDFETATV